MREVGGFRLLRELGRGGFGSVHLAEDAGGRTAAVKLLHVAAGTDPSFRQMFAREVDAARKVSPFCIAEVLDADPYAEQPWIATEYIDGPTLAEQIRKHGPRRGSDLQRLAVSTITALTAIHRAGVVHRDLKPENIMLAADGPRVIDFGIAKAFEESGAITASALIGTLQYMAPEQLEGDAKLTTAVDVFAWGSVMVYAASGQHAFPGQSQSAILKKILMDGPDCSQVPNRLREVVRRCLSKSPQDRPSAQEVLDGLLGSGASTDAETALNRGGTAVTNFEGSDGTRLNPTLDGTRREQSPVPPEPSSPAAAPAEHPSSAPAPAPASRPAPPRGSREAAGTSPPMEFGGRLYRSLDELVAAMQEQWSKAAAVFENPTERAALGAWIAQDLRDPRPDRRLFRVAPEDPDVAVARFVAQVRPDLPPVYQGEPLSHTDLRNWAVRTRNPIRSERVLPLDALDALAEHHCADGHACASGAPCTVYQDLARTVGAASTAADDVLAPYQDRMAGVSGSRARAVKEIGRADVVDNCAPFVVAVFNLDEWTRWIDSERERLPQEWHGCVPRVEPASTSVAERTGRAVAVANLSSAVAQAAKDERQARQHQERLTEFIKYHKRSDTLSSVAAVIGFIAGGYVLVNMTGVGLFTFDWPRFWWGLPLAVIAYLTPLFLASLVYRAPEGAVVPLLEDYILAVKVEQASTELESASGTLRELNDLRHNLSSATGPGY